MAPPECAGRREREVVAGLQGRVWEPSAGITVWETAFSLNSFLQRPDFVTQPWPGPSQQVFQAAGNSHRQELAEVSL